MRLVSDEAWAVMTIWCEARGEPQEGRIAVAEVIRNRCQRKYMCAGSVADCVLRPLQFSSWNTLDPNRRSAAVLDLATPVVEQCLQAWHAAMNGSDLACGAVLYLNPTAVLHMPTWTEQCRRVAIIGHHHFYIDDGNGRVTGHD